MAGLSINPITGAPDRTTSMQRAEMIGDGGGNFGAGAVAQAIDPGINPRAPRNVEPQTAVYFARNMSAVIPRRVILHAVNDSMVTLTEAVLRHYSPLETGAILKLCKDGRDMNIYADAIRPVRRGLRLDNRLYVIEPGKFDPKDLDEHGNLPKAAKDGEWTPIPEGLWDLYCGNWRRVHVPNPNEPKQLENEMRRVANFVGDWQPVFVKGEHRSPTAFIEFRREELAIQPNLAENLARFVSTGIEV